MRTFALVFDLGDALPDAARTPNHGCLVYRRWGFAEATLGYFVPDRREYEDVCIDEHVELLSIAGNIALDGNEAKVHSHVVVGKRDGIAHGGHLLQPRLRPTLALVFIESSATMQRTFDTATGLALLSRQPGRRTKGEKHMSRRQVVMITGGSAGVGRATAIQFARRGARIGLFARGRAGLEGAHREVLAAGGEALVCVGDVADPDAVEAAAASLEREFGPIDIWINNAMASVFSPISDMTPEDYQRVTAVTYLGFVYGTLSALRRMRPRNRGVIVQVGSALAYRGIPLQSAYCAAKHAVEGFCDSLRAELLHENSRIHVTMVQLPAINTPQFDWVKSRLPGRAQPVPPIFQPEVAADAIVWAADHRDAEVYLGWPTVRAIAANKIAPQYLDEYLAEHGVDSQQTGERERPDRPHNLWQPVDDTIDHGAHGRFDGRARDFSWQFFLSRHRRAIAGACAILAAAVLATRLSEAARPSPALLDHA